MADIPNPLTSFRLDGDVAFVTGGGNGIGREIARAFASAGAHVVVADIEEEAALSVADEIADAGLRAEAMVLNVTQEDAVGRAFSEVIKEHGRLDVLVNNAGVTIRAPAVELSLEDWKTVNDVNVTGVFICARTAARHMMAADGGRIVNIASIMGFSGGGLYPNPAYHTSKGAVVNLTRTLAVEWAKSHVRVNAVAPTWVRTRFIRRLLDDPDLRSEMERVTPLGRVAEPADVAAAALYLASPASAMVTGHILAVDGGYLAQ